MPSRSLSFARDLVTQHELLIRMVDRDGTVIAPNRFLPAAERFGLIEEIDDWVIGEAARLVGDKHAVTLQFNLSGKSLANANLARADPVGTATSTPGTPHF